MFPKVTCNPDTSLLSNQGPEALEALVAKVRAVGGLVVPLEGNSHIRKFSIIRLRRHRGEHIQRAEAALEDIFVDGDGYVTTHVAQTGRMDDWFKSPADPQFNRNTDRAISSYTYKAPAVVAFDENAQKLVVMTQELDGTYQPDAERYRREANGSFSYRDDIRQFTWPIMPRPAAEEVPSCGRPEKKRKFARRDARPA